LGTEIEGVARSVRLRECWPRTIGRQVQDGGHAVQTALPEARLPGEHAGGAKPLLPFKVGPEPGRTAGLERLGLLRGRVTREDLAENQADCPAVKDDVVSDQDQSMPLGPVRYQGPAQGWRSLEDEGYPAVPGRDRTDMVGEGFLRAVIDLPIERRCV